MNTPLIALGCELEKLLQLAISNYVDYTKRLPGARDNTVPFDGCLHGNCRDSRFPGLKCDTCSKACDGMLGDAMGTLVRSRRADRLSNYAPAAGGRQLPTAADIDGVLDIRQPHTRHDDSCSDGCAIDEQRYHRACQNRHTQQAQSSVNGL